MTWLSIARPVRPLGKSRLERAHPVEREKPLATAKEAGGCSNVPSRPFKHLARACLVVFSASCVVRGVWIGLTQVWCCVTFPLSSGLVWTDTFAANLGFAAFLLEECMARVGVFVDGENFRHSLRRLFSPHLKESDYLPKDAHWAELFDDIVHRVSADAFRIRTYWYVVEQLDCAPGNVRRLRSNRERAEQVLVRHPDFKDAMDAAVGTQGRADKVDELVNQLEERTSTMQRRFAGWLEVQDAISRGEEAVEFRRAGGIRYDLFTGQLGTEKAVDVNMACDMVALRDIYDVAVIVSGDQDYVPAVRIVKDAGRRVVNVSFRTRGGELQPGGARRLNVACDSSLILSYSDLARFFGYPDDLPA